MKPSGGWLTVIAAALAAFVTFLTLYVLHTNIFSSQQGPQHGESSPNVHTVPRYTDGTRSSANGVPGPSRAQSTSLIQWGKSHYLTKKSIPWQEFIHSKGAVTRKTPSKPSPTFESVLHNAALRTCPASVVNALQKPALKQTDIEWCQWATSPTGGGVMVGKSWGTLAKAEDRTRFDSLNCNAVTADHNPSCDDAWGDDFVRKWRSQRNRNVQCNNPAGSNIECHVSDNKEKFCVLENVMIDFAKAQKINKGTAKVASKKFAQDYMSMDCHEGTVEPAFTFPHLLSPSRPPSSKAVCDYVVEDTVLLFSHDNIRNMAHTLNDVMNVWLMLWLDGRAGNTSTMPFLTIDALKLYNNFDDLVNQYFTTCEKTFGAILRGADFGQGTLCLRRVLTQPLPARGFVWDNWHNDLPCSFVGPSSLYQRWNLQVRHSFGLLSSAVRQKFASQVLKVVLIVRTEEHNDWGSYRTSRLFLNQPEIVATIEQLRMQLHGGRHAFELVVQDFAKLSFEHQVQLMAETNILVGMHGAGISQSQYMSIGAERCCGVLEIFPRGEFTPVRGFANMIRKMGLRYSRIDISREDSLTNGAKVPVQELGTKLRELIAGVVREPACVLPQVIDDPYLLRNS